MDPVRLGRTLRAIRRHRGWRQLDVSLKAGVGQQTVSDIERGHAFTVGLSRTLSVAWALDAEVDVVVRWRGGAIDRLLDERHAAPCAAVARRLAGGGMEVGVEVSYSVYGERGAIDVLGWQSDVLTLVVVEVKSELTSIEATIRKHDEKIRLGPNIGADRFGARARRVAGLLVLLEDSTNRRRVGRADGILRPAYPLRGSSAWRALAEGHRPARGLVFLSATPAVGGRPRSGSRIVVSGRGAAPPAPTSRSEERADQAREA